jgi:hypothetical protein
MTSPFGSRNGGLAGLSTQVNQALAARAAGETIAAAPALPPTPVLPEPNLPPAPVITPPPTIADAPPPPRIEEISRTPAFPTPVEELPANAQPQLPTPTEIRQALGIPPVAPQPSESAEMPTIASAADAVRRTRERLAGRRSRASTVLTSRRARQPAAATPATLASVAGSGDGYTYSRRTLG